MLSRPPNKRWRRATGITYALICLLLDIGWQPEGPWDWTSDQGERFCVPEEAWSSSEDLDWNPFRIAFAQALARVLWRRASRHFCGAGLEAGADLTGISAQLRRLRARGKNEWFGAILASATGAQWPRTRLRDAGIDLDTVFCQRCDAQVEETLLHRCWECKANETIPACRKKEHLRRRAIADACNQPCVWLRGLVPKSWAQISAPAEEHGETLTGPPADPSWFWEGQLVAAGDASGGPHSSDKRLRRVGWAYALFRAPEGLDIDVIDRVGVPTIATGALPGTAQTINRGELFAFLRFLIGSRGVAKALFITDSAYVVKGVTRISAARGHGSNVDLWRCVTQELQGRQVACFKIESHMSIAEVLSRRVPAGAFFANLVADTAASRAADECQVSYAEAEGLRWSENLVASVRSRLAATFLHAVEHDQRAPKPPEEGRPLGRRTLAGRITASSHAIVRRGCHLFCTRCRGKVEARGSRAWLAAPCVIGPQAQEIVRGGEVRVGLQQIHPSHRHGFHEGLSLHFCSVCGTFARTSTRSAQIRGLAKPCAGLATRSGRASLRCIQKGQLPSSLHLARPEGDT